jgi:CO/xanthine dehydrogenase FAD-binding subunit
MTGIGSQGHRDHRGALADRGTRHPQIMRSALIKDMFPVLIEAAYSIGAVQTRNLGIHW